MHCNTVIPKNAAKMSLPYAIGTQQDENSMSQNLSQLLSLSHTFELFKLLLSANYVPRRYGILSQVQDSRTSYFICIGARLLRRGKQPHTPYFCLSNNNNNSCGQWMLLIDNNLGELDRCKTVAERFPDACGACHPTNCNVSTPVPTQAPTRVNETSKPTVTVTSRPTYEPFEVPNPDAPCGCYACDETVLSNVIFGFSCQERIDYLQSPPGGGYGYLEACVRVAESLPDNVCGPAW